MRKLLYFVLACLGVLIINFKVFEVFAWETGEGGDLGIQGKIVVNLEEKGPLPGDGVSQVNGKVNFKNDSGGDGEATVDARVMHTGQEDSVADDGTIIRSSFGSNSYDVSLSMSKKDGEGAIDFTSYLRNLVHLGLTQTTGNVTSISTGSAGNIVSTSAHQQVDPCVPANLKVNEYSEGYGVVFMAPDGKYIGAEASSYGKQSGDNPYGLSFNNTGQVDVSRSVTTGNNYVNTAGQANYNVPNGSTGYARTESYADIFKGNNYTSVSAFVRSSASQQAGQK